MRLRGSVDLHHLLPDSQHISLSHIQAVQRVCTGTNKKHRVLVEGKLTVGRRTGVLVAVLNTACVTNGFTARVWFSGNWMNRR